jgi:Amt family ammonium transporter
VVGARKDFGRKAILPHNVPHVLLGAGLLWFGWFGFNGGSALGANTIAALAFVNTLLAPMATLVMWMLLDAIRGQKITAVGAATGIVVGLVAITPAAGFIGPMAALALGALGAIPSYFMILYRSRTRLDDSLDVWAAHGTGGTVGAILTGVFATTAWNVGSGLMDGNGGQILTQAIAILGAGAYSAVATLVLLKAIGAVVGTNGQIPRSPPGDGWGGPQKRYPHQLRYPSKCCPTPKSLPDEEYGRSRYCSPLFRHGGSLSLEIPGPVGPAGFG